MDHAGFVDKSCECEKTGLAYNFERKLCIIELPCRRRRDDTYTQSASRRRRGSLCKTIREKHDVFCGSADDGSKSVGVDENFHACSLPLRRRTHATARLRASTVMSTFW